MRGQPCSWPRDNRQDHHDQDHDQDVHQDHHHSKDHIDLDENYESKHLSFEVFSFSPCGQWTWNRHQSFILKLHLPSKSAHQVEKQPDLS